MSNRLSQLPVEALVLSDTPIPLRLSQLPLEVLRSSTPEVTFARLSHLPLEVLLQVVTTAAHVSQLPLEVLREAEVAYASDVAVTQVVTELAHQQPDVTAVTQAALELAHHQLDSAVDATQAVVEIAWKKAPGPARITQLLIEIIRRPLPPGVDPDPPDYPVTPRDCGAGGEYPRLPADGAAVFPRLPESDCMDASTFVVNMALQEIGISKTIGTLSSDVSQEAYCARLIYMDVVDTVLRDHPWKFATEYAALVWLAGSAAAPVNPDWTYSFTLPTDCVRVRRVCDPTLQRRYTTTPVPFDQRANDTGTLDVLLCNEPGGGQFALVDPPTLTIEYTKRLACVAQVNDAQFRECLVMKLAARLAKSLARDSKDADRALRNYSLALPKAQVQHSNDSEAQRPTSANPDWLTGR